jgi:protein O-GlcNAc transferase
LRRIQKTFDALHTLGIVCSSTGNIQEADGFFRAALSIDPGFPPCHVNYGFCLLKQRRFTEAVESFDKALALFPNFAEPWLGRGNALRELSAARMRSPHMTRRQPSNQI